MIRIFFTFMLAITLSFSSKLPTEDILKKEIGQMIIIGFEGDSFKENDPFLHQIKKYNLGGVIFFDVNYKKGGDKNIKSPKQLKELIAKIKQVSPNIFISIDQEGGRVQRLKQKKGFVNTPSAKEIATMSEEDAKKSYNKMAQMLNDLGVNMNFAPVVDINVNKDNFISKHERIYGDDVNSVVKYSSIFIDELDNNKIISSLKHFPGYGSSSIDTHYDFTDITKTWNEIELEPYKILFKQKDIQMVMTAHVYNRNLDENYPATLSHNINTKLLKEKLGFDGVVISDDMQMSAISKHYSLNDAVTLAINSGVDILIFGNQLQKVDLDTLVSTIYQEIKDGKIKYSRVVEANKKIGKLKDSLKY